MKTGNYFLFFEVITWTISWLGCKLTEIHFYFLYFTSPIYHLCICDNNFAKCFATMTRPDFFDFGMYNYTKLLILTNKGFALTIWWFHFKNDVWIATYINNVDGFWEYFRKLQTICLFERQLYRIILQNQVLCMKWTSTQKLRYDPGYNTLSYTTNSDNSISIIVIK